MFSTRPTGFWLLAVLSLSSLIAADTASVSGTVINGATGTPLHMALVTITTVGQKPLDAAVYTDGKGAFSMDVPPGRYYLEAAENGYARTWFGAPTLDVAPAVMTVRAGEVRQGICLRLDPLVAISGTVVDQDNDPVPNARVRLVVPTFARGKQTYRSRNGGGSDDRGEFRLHGILPGRYYLAVAPRNTSASAVRPDVSITDPSPELTYTPTYYPGVATIAEATALDVRSGADIHNIVLRLNAQEAATVSGTVELPEGISAAGGISVQFMSLDELTMQSTMRWGVGVTDDNKFHAPHVAPGRYKVTITLQGGEYRTSEVFDFHPGPQEITVHFAKQAHLAGHLTVEGEGRDLTKTEIALSSGDGNVGNIVASVKADGGFEFPALDPGVWDIDVHPVPKGGYIKSMMLGGQDVLTAEMVIGPQTTAPLNIVVSSRGAVVSGTVKVPQDDLADLTGHPRAKVLLAPAGRFSDVLSFFHYTNSDESGEFTLRGVTPGSYKIFAFDRLKAQAWWDPAFMKRIDSLGKPLEIHEGEHVSVDLDMKSMPPAASEEP